MTLSFTANARLAGSRVHGAKVLYSNTQSIGEQPRSTVYTRQRGVPSDATRRLAAQQRGGDPVVRRPQERTSAREGGFIHPVIKLAPRQPNERPCLPSPR